METESPFSIIGEAFSAIGALVIGGSYTSDEAEELAHLIAGQTPCPEETAATGEAK
ncbi:hypothetical protein KUV65_09665 [Maritalea mobilis]|uniref:hypothetical protein n=1 Tax=Maritalea mobilis TaxID=483324 RepID=UPI001C981B37|nr:hypothetical protein [Maritalea mobilis]MBY6201629.1 hypothetical protein [Maritalea mobilis]